MKKEIEKVDPIARIFSTAFICFGGWLIFMVIEMIIRLTQGSPPWPLMILFTLLFYSGVGITAGGIAGGVIVLLLKVVKRWQQRIAVSSHPRKGVYAKRVSLVDIMPTILYFLGLPLPKDLQGVDLFKGSSRVMSEIYRHESLSSVKGDRFVRELKSLSLDNYKYIKEYARESGGQAELYHIDNDPGELYNLIEELPGKAQEMEVKWMKWLPQVEA